MMTPDTTDRTKEKQDFLLDTIAWDIQHYDLDILLGPEFLFVFNDRPYPKEKKQALIDRLIEISTLRDVLIVPGTVIWEDEKYFYNDAPVIYNGKLIAEYYKHLGAGTLLRNTVKEGNKSLYEGKDTCLFTWRKYRVGLEICADNGLLQDYLDKNKIPYPDLYLLPSYGFTFKGLSISASGKGLTDGGTIEGVPETALDPPVKKGGYGFNVDGGHRSARVSKNKGDGEFEQIKEVRRDESFSLFEIWL